jgi:hypothetical protein
MKDPDLGRHYLAEALKGFRALKTQGERAIAQVSDQKLFATLDAEANSIAVLVKHLAGNMRSRWTDFLTSDGEKPDRRRDTEFELGPSTARAEVLAWWEAGWKQVLDSVGALSPEDLMREVKIRGEPHTVLEAINRQLTHYAGHVAQIVLLAKHESGPEWKTLSIPRGQSEQVNARMRGRVDRPG